MEVQEFGNGGNVADVTRVASGLCWCWGMVRMRRGGDASTGDGDRGVGGVWTRGVGVVIVHVD